MKLRSINPTNGELIAEYESYTPGKIEARIAAADEAFRRHSKGSFESRRDGMLRLADLLESGVEEFSLLMTLEMGKPIAQARAEAQKCAWVCRYYADNAESMLADESVATDALRSYVAFQPLGPILAVMPWNFPFWQVLRFAAPAIMAGNVALLKHASNVSGCALAIERLFREAGFEQGVFQTLLVSHDALSSILSDSRIRAATLTGSDEAGRSVGALAGAHLKPIVLELGGSDPFIVLKDAPIEKTVQTALAARMQNNGQSCIAAKRFIVEEPVAQAFTDALVAAVESMTVGDPVLPETNLGPLARKDLLETIADQVDRAVVQGARIETGGRSIPGPGYFYAPTVLGGVEPGTVAFDEELFGPVAPVIVAKSAEHSVELANDSVFGLGAAVFSADVDRAELLALQLEAGCTFVNSMVRSDPRLPFGGVKDSGFGRELSTYGIREFVNVKTVYVESAP